MARVKAKSPFRWIRRIVLLFGLLVVGAVAVLLAAYQFASYEPEEADLDRALIDRELGNDLSQAEDVEFVQTVGDRVLFRIQAKRSRQDASDYVFLETVELELYHENGDTYHVTSDSALFNESTKHARLTGHVVLRGWDRLEIRARALELQNNGQVLISETAVQMRYPPDLEGRASNLRADFQEDAVVLGGGVHLRTVPEAPYILTLDSERLEYQRRAGYMIATGSVKMRRDDQYLLSRSVQVFLGPDRQPQTVRATWDVYGSIENDPMWTSRRVDFQADEMLLEYDGSEPRRLQLDAREGGRRLARIQITDATGLAQRISAGHLVGHLAGGQVDLLEATGRPVGLEELLAVDPPFLLRQTCAREVKARFLADGTLARIELGDEIDIQDGEVQLTGGTTAAIDTIGQSLTIKGRAVSLLSDRGELVAPQFEFDQAGGNVRATGGVRTTLDADYIGALKETPLGQGSGPVNVESPEALFSRSPNGFVFLGGVRAWRDANLLLAEQLRGTDSPRLLSASGQVKTLWVPEGLVPAGGRQEPIEVSSEQLRYEDASQSLIYSGGVRLLQDQRDLSCNEMTVELTGQQGEAERMVCAEEVQLVDPVHQRRIFGDQAIYTLRSEQVEITGEVRAVNGKGMDMQAGYLIYDIPTGRVFLQGQIETEPVTGSAP